jgi:hypothetical protein
VRRLRVFWEWFAGSGIDHGFFDAGPQDFYPAPCYCCGHAPASEDQLCDNENCDLFEEESA